MKITFLGASGTVTGSSYALTSGAGQSILIDLGMFQGLPDIEELNYRHFAFDARKLTGVVLTHAHLDHCGRLPIILPKGFRGEIYMTLPTADLTEIALVDSAKVAKQDHKEILYDRRLALKTIDQFKTEDYRTPFRIGDFVITFRDAGHILGSATLEITDTQANSEIKKIVFSGDLGNSPEDLVKPTELLDTADAVVMESTYGDKLHPTDDPSEALLKEVQAVEESGGVLLIPSFALEKTQELLHMLMHLKEEGKIKFATPVVLDSPLAEKATYAYLDAPQLLNEHLQQELKTGIPFDFPGLKIMQSIVESADLDKNAGPLVIIAGSGMMSGGRIMAHAATFLPLPTTRIFFTGYQGEGTIGRALIEGQKEVEIDGYHVPVKASINKTEAMSSHADQGQLLKWLGAMKGVKKVFITHGEDPSREALKQKITETLSISDVTLPKLNQEFEF
jgi:metallo-beta-lactamase family protein